MADIMTDEELAELRALEAAATPGPWADDASGHYGVRPRIYGDGYLIAEVGNAQPALGDFWDADAKFIVAARNALPRLLAMLDAERAEVARLREAARGQIVVVEAARQMQAQAERERDETRAENARLRAALGKIAAMNTEPRGMTSEDAYDAPGPYAHVALAALDKVRGDGWRTMDSAPTDGQAFLAVVCGQVRIVAYTKTSHVPVTGFCLADQGADDFDLCNPTCWQPLPAPPTTEGE
jgi:hypothetical protein